MSAGEGETRALEVVREAYDSTAGLDRKDPVEEAEARRSFVKVLSEEFEFRFVGPSFGDERSAGELGGLAGSGRGLDEFAAGWDGWLEAFDSYRIWPLEYESRGDRVLVIFRVQVTLAGARTPIETEQGVLVTVADGRFASMDMYYRGEDARAAWERA